jgi:phosphoribosylformylglycinamidine synthase
MTAGARPRVSVIVFPGSNCDHDAANAVEETIGAEARLIWHARTNLESPDLVILPGGFSYGDYLRCGALARFSPVMDAVRDFAAKGGPVLGICNGFQVLCEAELLPGALLLNSGQRFRCEDVFVRVETIRTPFTAELTKGDVLRLPIAHGDGNWRAEAESWRDVTTHDQVVFRYCDSSGTRATGANPNGSLDDVAGVCNRERNVVGLMPHPERASEALLGNADGARLFRSFANVLLLGRTS